MACHSHKRSHRNTFLLEDYKDTVSNSILTHDGTYEPSVIFFLFFLYHILTQCRCLLVIIVYRIMALMPAGFDVYFVYVASKIGVKMSFNGYSRLQLSETLECDIRDSISKVQMFINCYATFVKKSGKTQTSKYISLIRARSAVSSEEMSDFVCKLTNPDLP